MINDCFICRQLIINDEIIICKNCDGSFHPEHLMVWLNYKETCPVCKIKLTRKTLFPNFLPIDYIFDPEILKEQDIQIIEKIQLGIANIVTKILDRSFKNSLSRDIFHKGTATNLVYVPYSYNNYSNLNWQSRYRSAGYSQTEVSEFNYGYIAVYFFIRITNWADYHTEHLKLQELNNYKLPNFNAIQLLALILNEYYYLYNFKPPPYIIEITS